MQPSKSLALATDESLGSSCWTRMLVTRVPLRLVWFVQIWVGVAEGGFAAETLEVLLEGMRVLLTRAGANLQHIIHQPWMRQSCRARHATAPDPVRSKNKCVLQRNTLRCRCMPSDLVLLSRW